MAKIVSDPEFERWKRKYPDFPTLLECERLVLLVNAKGLWIDLIVEGIAARAEFLFIELVDSDERNVEYRFSLLILMALELAAIPESVAFLVDVAMSAGADRSRWARSALVSIDTRESRTALFLLKSKGQDKVN